MFCVLADVFTHDLSTHARFKVIDDDPRTRRVLGAFEFFTTKSNFASQTCCVIGLWEVISTTAPQ